RLLWPTAFALYNWAAQWATYHLVLRATHVPVSLAASFTALIVVNLGGLLRPTPANIGVTQAALVVGLLPFGVAPENAVAAGLAHALAAARCAARLAGLGTSEFVVRELLLNVIDEINRAERAVSQLSRPIPSQSR